MTAIALPFEIVHCSSFDPHHGPDQLVASSPGNRSRSDRDDHAQAHDLSTHSKVKGWQTPKCPTYPQDLILHLQCGPARISKVQILSHHYKIATRIEVYIGVLKYPNAQHPNALASPTDPEEEDDMLVEFTRLGYVCLDNNTSTQFRARELKSVKVNADGEYIRLVIRNCHRNRLNTYSQVGLLGLNVSGHPLRSSANNGSMSAIPSHMARHLHHPLDETSMLSSSTRRTSVSSCQSGTQRLITSSAMDPELGQWISALIQAEEEAVQDEAYQLAKSYKQLSDKLSEIASVLSSLEYEKKQAVEAKDYDEAEKLKTEMSEMKRSANLLLKEAGIQVTRDGQVTLAKEEETELDMAPDSLLEQSIEMDAAKKYDTEDCTLVSYGDSQQTQDQLYDEAIEKWTSFDTQTMTKEKQVEQVSVASSLSTDPADMLLPPHLTSYGYDNQCSDNSLEDTLAPLPKASMSKLLSPSLSSAVARKHSLRGSPLFKDQRVQEQPPLDPECIPEPLIEAERENCLVPIRIFGEDVVANVLSVKVKCRERGLTAIATRVCAACSTWTQKGVRHLEGTIHDESGYISPEDSEDDVDEDTRQQVLFIKATLMMLQEAVTDSRESIIQLTIGVWQDLNDLYDTVPTNLIFGLMERAFSGLLMRTNESNSRIRQAATQLVLDLAYKYCEPPYSLLSLFVGKPERVIHSQKDARARIELVRTAVEQLCIRPEGIVPLDDVMNFAVTYLNHSHNEVRQAAVELVVCISDQVDFQLVSKYIDKDLRVSLAETMRKIVANQKDKEPPAPTSNKTSDAVAELRALAAKASVPVEKPTSNGKKKSAKPATAQKPATAATRSARPSSTRGTKTNKSQAASTTAPPPSQPSQDTSATADDNSMCIFCEEVNPNFNEDTLITHYYDQCPILTNCPMCHIILEIPTMNEHILSECDQRHLVKQCGRCKDAVPVEQWLQHTLKQNCTALTNPNEKRCPFCRVAIEPPTEAGWKSHLLSGTGCPKNPRSSSLEKHTPSKRETTTTKTSSVRRKK